jgi:hypothetical protein
LAVFGGSSPFFAILVYRFRLELGAASLLLHAGCGVLTIRCDAAPNFLAVVQFELIVSHVLANGADLSDCKKNVAFI